MHSVTLVSGIDVGNGYVKAKTQVNGEAKPHIVDMPACLSYTAQAQIPKEPTVKLLDTLANQADLDIRSNAIDSISQGRALFGERAVRSGAPLAEFDIDSARPKCEDALSTMLILDVVASEALRAWSLKHAQPGQTRDLPLPDDVLSVEATIALALPIEDYVQYRSRYAQALRNANHMVRFCDFETPVDVRIKFKNVVVLAEGAAGQYAIASLGPQFLDAALADSRSKGMPIDEGYTGEALVGATNTIGVDIGEGTVNFPVFVNGDVSVEASSSIKRGWGSVLTDVVSRLRSSQNPFGSRKALADFLLVEHPLPAQARLRVDVEHELELAKKVFARELMGEFGSVWRRVGLRTDVIYVYGGGSTNMQDVLWPLLVEAATLGSGQAIPVIWLDGSYSRDLNRNGLFEAAKLAASM